MTLLSIIGVVILIQVMTGVALGLWVAYLSLRGPRHSLNTTRQLRNYPAPHSSKSTGRTPQASD